MKFKTINTLSIKDMLLAKIEEMILSGELKPGDKLPTEREIADAMSISKTIVHEGIRELARMGFLDVISRQGVYVADYASTGNLDTLLAIIRFRGGMPDKKMISSLLDMRIYLECPAIELLAASHTSEDIQKMTQLEETKHQAQDKYIKTFAEILFLYRRTLVVLSGNCISPLVMNAFFDASISAWADYCEFIGREAAFASLVQTTDYIKNGNATGAITLFKGQIEQYRRHLHAS